MKRLLSIAILSLVVFGLAGQTGPSKSTLNLHFQFQFAGKPISPDSLYVTAFGDSLKFDRIRFYAGLFGAFTRMPGTEHSEATRGYFIIDSGDSLSQMVPVHLSITGPLTEVTFSLGVDSTTQISGARTGVLDPLKGMYWTWNSGYVTAKIEGSVRSSGRLKPIEYHLGGYRAPNAAMKMVKLKSDSSQNLTPETPVDLNVAVDLARFFAADFSVKQLPAFMTPGPKAKEMTFRFASCFLSPVPSKQEP